MPNQNTTQSRLEWHAFVVQRTGAELHPFGTFNLPLFHLSDAEQFRDDMSNLHPQNEFKIFKAVVCLWDESSRYATAPLDSFSNVFERMWVAAHRERLAQPYSGVQEVTA